MIDDGGEPYRCNWKVYGLFGHLGKGLYVFAKDVAQGEQVFMPLAWESEFAQQDQPSPAGIPLATSRETPPGDAVHQGKPG